MSSKKTKFMTGYNKAGKLQYQGVCVDVYPPSAFKEAEQSLAFKAIGMRDAIWKPGAKGKISITFGQFGCAGCSPDSAWSHIGSNSTTQFPSMNLGFMDPPFESFELDGVTYTAPPTAMRNYCGPEGKVSCEQNWQPGATVIHEFCHALGMMHEHQNDLEGSNQIKLNEDAVLEYYNRIGLGRQGAVTNVLERYSCNDEETCEYSGTKYDDQSIMLYYLPDDWIDGPNPTRPNFKLSEDDKNYLKMNYPKNINNPPEITVEFVDGSPEPWKVAWTKKMVLETFGPLLGIKWIFKDNLEKKITTSTTEPATTEPATTEPSTTEPSTTEPSTTEPLPLPVTKSGAGEIEVIGFKLQTYELALVIIGIVLLFILISALVMFLTSRKSRRKR